MLDRLEAGSVVELTGGSLEAQVEPLFLGLLEEALDLFVGLLVQILDCVISGSLAALNMFL